MTKMSELDLESPEGNPDALYIAEFLQATLNDYCGKAEEARTVLTKLRLCLEPLAEDMNAEEPKSTPGAKTAKQWLQSLSEQEQILSSAPYILNRFVSVIQ